MAEVNDDGNKGWDEYRRLILAELERFHKDILRLESKIDAIRNAEIADLRVSVGELKIKAGVWGLIGGLVPVAISMMFLFMRQ